MVLRPFVGYWSDRWSELGVMVEPTIASTLFSEMSLRVLVTALVVSEPSSSIQSQRAN